MKCYSLLLISVDCGQSLFRSKTCEMNAIYEQGICERVVSWAPVRVKLALTKLLASGFVARILRSYQFVPQMFEQKGDCLCRFARF